MKPQTSQGANENASDHSPQKSMPSDPDAVDPDAVKTVIDSNGDTKKYGWQHPPTKEDKVPLPCAHIARIQARLSLPLHDIGHEWICTCGQTFVVAINSGGRKILIEKTQDPA